MNKEGQIAIWVIIAVMIVAAIIFLFALRRSPTAEIPEETNPQLFIQKCIRDNVNEVVGEMLPQGGFVEPVNYKLYNNTKVSYLCLNRGYYYPCVNQHPMLLNEMKKEIEDNIKLKVDTCYSILKLQFEQRAYDVSMENTPVSLDVELKPGRIDVNVGKKVTLTKGDSVTSFDKFDVAIQSHTYELGSLAVEIANQEATYCNFEYVGYMTLYPEFKIRREARSDGTRIYILEDKRTRERMQFAVRGCVTPQGI